MQRVTVARDFGIKGNSRVAQVGVADVIPSGALRLFPPVSSDHSIFVVSQQWRGRPEFKIGFLRLT
jgi:tetraacyldisaccharide-1-P 4'-kinase